MLLSEKIGYVADRCKGRCKKVAGTRFMANKLRGITSRLRCIRDISEVSIGIFEILHQN